MRNKIVTATVALVAVVFLTGFNIYREDVKCCELTSESSFVVGAGAVVVPAEVFSVAVPVVAELAAPRSQSDEDSASRSNDSDPDADAENASRSHVDQVYSEEEDEEDVRSFTRRNRWERMVEYLKLFLCCYGSAWLIGIFVFILTFRDPIITYSE